jgi:hypothetical protein
LRRRLNRAAAVNRRAALDNPAARSRARLVGVFSPPFPSDGKDGTRMSVHQKLTRISAVAFAVVLAALGTSAAADATTAPTTTTVQQGMYVAGFDPQIAAAHGYKIVTYPNGDQQSVPVDANSTQPKSLVLHHNTTVRGVMAPDANSDYDRVVGNCGISWIAVQQTAASQVQVGSGFTVFPAPAVGYSWTISLSDRNGTSHQSAEGGLFFRTSWARVWTKLNQHGYTFDYVLSGVADLDDGTVCFSGRPSVSISGLA